MLLHNKNIAILGAGPVGLTMARLLQQKGINVTVYERDKGPHTRIWGGPLDLHKGSGQDALAAAGLLEEYYANALPMGRTVADEHGNILFSKSVAPGERYDNPEINRNDLRTLLINSLAKGTVVWDRKFTGLTAQDGRWLLHFENQPDATAHLVIGANGGMSAARKYVTDAAIEYTGSFIIQGHVPQPEIACPALYQLCNGTILMASHRGNLLVANPKNGGLLSYALTLKMPGEWSNGNELDFKDTNTVIAYLLNRYAGWDKVYRQLFKATTFFAGLATRKIPMEIPWKTNRPLPITLIGDAAHIMPPFAGQGVNTGLKDALLLADNLTNTNFKTIDAAITDYEQKMLVYATQAQLETAINEAAMHQPGFSFQKRFSR